MKQFNPTYYELEKSILTRLRSKEPFDDIINDVPYNGAPSELIPQLPVSTKPPKADAIAIVISSSVPYTYHSDIDLAVKSGKKYASWSMQTALCINNANSKSMNLSVSKPYSNDPHNKWDRTYKLTFDSVIKAIRYAISQPPVVKTTGL